MFLIPTLFIALCRNSHSLPSGHVLTSEPSSVPLKHLRAESMRDSESRALASPVWFGLIISSPARASLALLNASRARLASRSRRCMEPFNFFFVHSNILCTASDNNMSIFLGLYLPNMPERFYRGSRKPARAERRKRQRHGSCAAVRCKYLLLYYQLRHQWCVF